MKELTVKVCANREIAPGIYELDLALPEEIDFRCGQFVNLSVGDGAHLLRRPFAVMSYDRASRIVCVCYQVKGEGTKLLSRAKEGDMLTCVLPLGNGFCIAEEQKRVALIGGGVGVFPLLSVLREYRESDKHFRSYMGFRSAEYVNTFCMYDKRSDALFIATDDGSFGEKGTAVSEPCFVSLEERMGCGIGACLVCVCKKSGSEENARVCKDGPVFDINEVEI